MMRNISSKQMSLWVCILLSATHAAAGPGAESDKLSPCPDAPNCVSSLSADKARFIAPLHYTGSLADARQKLINLLESSPRVRLVKVESYYLHAEFRSFIFRFVDDVEFYLPAEESIIHVKSASRAGYYDFGVNRRRVEGLRSAFENLAK